MTALDLIVEVGPEHHATIVDRVRNSATFEVRPPLVSGAPAPEYLIDVSPVGRGVVAREVVPARLPAFCPERHINTDGTFCLYWAEEEPMEFVTAIDASNWWSKMLVFLERQRLADRIRRWPGKAEARAHGSEAARHQAEAERLAAIMGPTFERRLREDRFGVTRRVRFGEGRLRLESDGQRVCTVIESIPRVMTLRSLCRCDEAPKRRLPLKSCGNHAEVLARLVTALHGQELEEKRFFERIRATKHRCCGSIDDCPLAA